MIGLSLTRSLARLYPTSKIVLLEKESGVAEHTSGRNSGVLHAGFYYASDSLKATFCRTGNQMWHEFCEGRGALVRRCGKLVVPKVCFITVLLVRMSRKYSGCMSCTSRALRTR